MTPNPQVEGRRVSVHLSADLDERVVEKPTEVPQGADAPFGILLVGDFRGVGEGAPAGVLPEFAERTPVPVDRDDLDEVVSQLRPAVRVQGTQAVPGQRIDVRSMADFHPDRLVRSAPVLRRLLQERDEGPGERSAAAGGEPSGERGSGGGEGSGDEGDGAADPLSGSEVLDRILESGPESKRSAGRAGQDPPATSGSDLDAYVRRLADRYAVPGEDPEEEERRSALDRELTYQLRHVLHDARFRALEARWRGVSMLVHRLETGVDLKVFLLQADPGELDRALRDDGFERLLRRSSQELLRDTSWGLVVVHHAFQGREEDLTALARLAEAVKAVGSAAVAEADPSLLGLGVAGEGAGLADAWAELRASEAAGHVGLALPRFLARLPYAPGENPCETLDFQELQLKRPPDPGHLVWAHPGILVALLLGAAFRMEGWGFTPGRPDRVDDLPLALHRGEEGVAALPTTEVLLDEQDAANLLDAGLIPVVARPGGATAHFPALRSLAASGAMLRGPW